MNSTSVAVGSSARVVSGVGVVCGEQPRIARTMMLRIAVSEEKRDDNFGMKVIKQSQTYLKPEAVLCQR